MVGLLELSKCFYTFGHVTQRARGHGKQLDFNNNEFSAILVSFKSGFFLVCFQSQGTNQ